MASLAEMKAALEAEQARAREAFDLSVDAVSTVSSIASWTITGLAVIIALVALFGWAVIVKSSRTRASLVAEQSVSTYLSSPQFDKLLEEMVAKEVSERMRTDQVAENADIDDADPFPGVYFREEDDR